MKTWQEFAKTATFQEARIDYLKANSPDFAAWWEQWEHKLNRCGSQPVPKLTAAVQVAIDELLARYAVPCALSKCPAHPPDRGKATSRAHSPAEPVPALRADVQAFAAKMSAIMNEKEPDKGSVEQTPISEPLMKLDYLVGRLKEHGTLNPENSEHTKRLLIHIANFAMIAESKL